MSPVDGSGSDFDVFVPAIPVQGSYVVGALLQKFLADAAVRPDVRFLDDHLAHQFIAREGVVALKSNAADLVFFARIDLIHDEDLIRLSREIGRHLDVGESLFLKVVGKVPLPFVDQVPIDGSLGVNRNQPLHSLCCQQGNDREPSANGANDNDRADIDFERDVDAMGFCVVHGRIFFDSCRQPILLCQRLLHQGCGRSDSLGFITLAGLEKSAGKTRA